MFKSGKDWNGKPGPGRPPLPADTREAFAMMSVDARNALREIANNPKHPRHEQACEYIENKHSGTPRQSVDVNTNAPITAVEVTLVAPDGKKTSVPAQPAARGEESDE